MPGTPSGVGGSGLGPASFQGDPSGTAWADHLPVSECAAAGGLDSGEIFCLGNIDTTTMENAAKNSLCRFPPTACQKWGLPKLAGKKLPL